MRLTVGPLPSAVYWRRRAVVLGAGLLFLIVLLYSCTRSGDTGTTSGTGSSPSVPAAGGASPTAASPTTPGSASPSGAADAPDSSAALTTEPGTSSTPPADPPVNPARVDDGTCTDSEVQVTPVALPAEVRRGAPVDLSLKIKNRSQRTCNRDVGADVQELFIKSGAEKVWSSDTCGTGKGSDVQSFTPGFERSYQLTWNGMDASRCSQGVASGPNPPAGNYQVFARVGTKLSEPVKLVVTG
ncbi:hypothetical protein GA0070216_109111 [Micromonospora matsumotoense]|uniref:Uncharacterized protein n=1 Tax=Micromonospora matsumotoense TaxID=121616 RepID=A0A1C4ZDI5_9ACTN|nr:hypothetical protein [Micromonospora matsumotoense]SCF31070.1 hypothetical protein GA0070216_109111 [Micromonospora matsumotoense]